jgi:prepilin peptidase CpaA
MLLAALLFLVAATICDLRSREIPDWIAAGLLACALGATGFGLTEVTWLGLLGGAMLAFVLGLPLFAAGGFGGGDVKLVVALGAALGPLGLLSTLFWVAIAGGILALVALARGKRELAYVPAIALGLCIHLGVSGDW